LLASLIEITKPTLLVAAGAATFRSGLETLETAFPWKTFI